MRQQQQGPGNRRSTHFRDQPKLVVAGCIVASQEASNSRVNVEAAQQQNKSHHTHTHGQATPAVVDDVCGRDATFVSSCSILESLNRTRPLGSHQPHHLLTSHLDSPMDSTMPTSYRPAAGVRRGPCPPPRRGTDWGHGPSPKPLALAVEATHAGHVQASRSLACLDH